MSRSKEEPSLAPNYRELPIHSRWTDESYWAWLRDVIKHDLSWR